MCITAEKVFFEMLNMLILIMKNIISDNISCMMNADAEMYTVKK